jgi:ATP-dependent RNA helicase DDX24/MAK5
VSLLECDGAVANFPEDLVERLDFRDKAPEVIDLSPEGGVVKMLKESMIDCVMSDKVSSHLPDQNEADRQDLYLYYFLLRYPGRSLVFVGSIDGIRRLMPLFEVLQMPVFPLHSQLQQRQRLKNLDR